MFGRLDNYAKITAFYSIALDYFDMDLHQHAAYEIMFVNEGACKVYLPDRDLALRPNDFVCIATNQKHALKVEKGTACTLLNLEFILQNQPTDIGLEDIQSVAKTFFSEQAVSSPCVIGKDIRQFGQALTSLIQLLILTNSQTMNKEENQFSIALQFKRMMMELIVCLRAKKSALGNKYVNQAIAIIQAQYDQSLLVSDIAAEIGITPAYLHQLFFAQMGTSVGQFLTDERLKQAVFLLANSQLPIIEIAIQSGFNSRQHFSNTFKKKKGLTPKAYRQLYRQEIMREDGQHILDGDAGFSVMVKKTYQER